MTVIGFLTAWANAPFTIALGIAAVFALLQVSGLLGVLGSADGEADVDHDVDHDLGDAGTHAGKLDALFFALGVGRIPFALVWQTWAIVFALTGLALNAGYLGGASIPLVTWAWTLPAGFVAGGVAVAVVNKLLGPLFATKEHEATSRAELVGLAGVVISSQVTDEFGEVRVRDRLGHDIRVICRLAPGSLPPSEHDRVVVVEYVEESQSLLVAPIESGVPSSRSNDPTHRVGA